MIEPLGIKTPDRFHRNFRNDLPNVSKERTLLVQAERATFIALPFISLYQPAEKVLAIGASTARVFTCSGKLVSAIKGDKQKIGESVFNTGFAISSLMGAIFLHSLGLLMTTGHDLTLNGCRLYEAITEGDKDRIISNTLQLANNVFYFLVMVRGSFEIRVLSLVSQVIVEGYSSFKTFKDGYYPEFTGHALMAVIRANQRVPEFRILK